jgi:hypothetical protein
MIRESVEMVKLIMAAGMAGNSAVWSHLPRLN